jgi:hypothetical protein
MSCEKCFYEVEVMMKGILSLGDNRMGWTYGWSGFCEVQIVKLAGVTILLFFFRCLDFYSLTNYELLVLTFTLSLNHV